MQKSKRFWFDVETTGVDPKINAIIQLACIVEFDGQVFTEFEMKMAPWPTAIIELDALETNGKTTEEIMDYQPPGEAFLDLKNKLSHMVNSFDKEDKFVLAGFNVGFDENFLRAMFIREHDKYFGSRFFNCPLDVRSFLAEHIYETGLRLPNYKLVTVCEHFGIPIDAHDAMSDVKATRALYRKLKTLQVS